MALGSTRLLVKMSIRKTPGGKGVRCLRLTTSPPSRAECHEIREPKPPGTLWATPGLLRDCFTFNFTGVLSRQGCGSNEWCVVKDLVGDVCDVLDVHLFSLFISRLMQAALNITSYPIPQLKFDFYWWYSGAYKSLARPTSRCILFDGGNISFVASLVIYKNSTNIPPIMIINRIRET